KAPNDVILEADITRRMNSNVEKLTEIGTPTVFTCPDCGGILMQIEEEPVHRYRCYTGHSFTEQVLEDRQVEELEESLWVAIRMMEERRNLLISMAEKSKNETLRNSERL